MASNIFILKKNADLDLKYICKDISSFIRKYILIQF